MMILSESYRERIQELAGIKLIELKTLLKEVEDLYSNSKKRVKFDVNIMEQAIDGGMEMGLIFQSNNDKYTMPVWKMRIIQPVAMGYDKKGQLVIRGVHVEGQSEKRAIETGVRSAQANDEWRLFKASNIKSMFFTGRLFTHVSLPGYNPNDSAMTKIIVSFNHAKAVEYQKTIKNIEKQPEKPIIKPVTKPVPAQKQATQPVVQKSVSKPNTSSKQKYDAKKLQTKIDKLNKLL